MNPLRLAKRATRNAFNLLGVDIQRARTSPGNTLLGLRNRPIKSIIDIGANAGQFAQHISMFYPEARLYCFEPLADPFLSLKEWASTQAGRVEVFNLALGDTPGQVEMNYHADHSPSSSLLESTALTRNLYPVTIKQKSVAIKLARLDDVLGTRLAELQQDILIKMDVQGYEDRVIRGGEAVMSAAAACILEVCLDGLYAEQANFQDLLAMLYRLGFRYAGNLDQSYGEDGHVIYLDAVFLK
jgi:FkbM family methyltransferase